MKKFLFIFFTLIILIVLYARFINTSGFQVVEDTIAISNLPDSFNDFKIVQFSDVLLGSTKTINDLENVINKINELNPDIIVFTGDLIAKNYDISESEITKVKEYLSDLDCTLYKYAVIGDNDKNNLELYKEIINDSNFILLDDLSTYIFYEDITPIKLTGITNINNLEQALYMPDELDTFYNIVLTHEPDNVDVIASCDVDLVLAGHSLLGQIRLPFWGGILKKDGSKKYLDHEYQVNNTSLYVSSGLGTDKNIKFRLFNKPTINLYRLEQKVKQV